MWALLTRLMEIRQWMEELEINNMTAEKAS